MRTPAALLSGRCSSNWQNTPSTLPQRQQRAPQQHVKRQARLNVEAVARAQGEYSTNRLTLTPPANPAGSPLAHSVPSVSTSRATDHARLGRLGNSLNTSIPALQNGSGTETGQQHQQQDRDWPNLGLQVKAETSDSSKAIASASSSVNGNGNGFGSNNSNGRSTNSSSSALSGASSVLSGSTLSSASSNFPPAPTTARAARSGEDVGELQMQMKQLRSALEVANLDRLHAEARAREAELSAQQAQDALQQAQESSTSLNRQYHTLCDEIDLLRARESTGGAGPSPRSMELTRQVDDLQAQLEDLDYRLGWALRDLRAHQLVLRAQGELNMHLSGLPSNMQQQIFDQVDSGAELLGDGGSATVHAITLNGEPLAVKVMPLYDINTARPYHFRDICTTFLRHQRSPYIEMPLHTFLRLKDDEVEGTQYYLYTVWPRRHMDVDQLLCRRNLRPMEILTIMHHSVLALQDLALARMVHADVKPPNVLVMLGPDGLVQSAHLTDFGSVQFVPPGEEAAPAIWDNQLAWNWPPEQRDLVYLEACDVWGLGLLYSCMKVINPSKAEVTDVLQDVTTSKSGFERVRDTELLPTYTDDPQEIRTLTLLMRRCVVQDPKQRPSIKELAVTIPKLHEQMMQRLGVTAPAKQGR